MPFIMFKSKEDHSNALDVIADVIESLENGPLERFALFSPIIKLDGKFSEPHKGVYVFCHAYLSIFSKSKIGYVCIPGPEQLNYFLSADGIAQLKHIENTRPHHIV